MVDAANVGREAILQHMLKTISAPREELHDNAPALLWFKVERDQVRTVIGSWGSTIQWIIAETWVSIDLEDDGSWVITATSQADAHRAFQLITDLFWEPSAWDQMSGKATRVEKYWVFVDLWKGKSGLMHVKNFWLWFVEDANAHYKVGDQVDVEILWVDQGKIQLKKQTGE